MTRIETMPTDIIDPDIGIHVGTYSVFPPYTKTHDHIYGEIFIIASGQMIQEHGLAPQKELVTEGTVMFLAPHHRHRFRRHKRDDCCMINVAISPKTLDAIGMLYGKEIFEKIYWQAPGPRRIQLGVLEKENLIRRLPGEELPKERQRFLLRSIVVELFGRLMGNDEEGQSFAMPAWMDKLCARMREKDNFVRGVEAMHVLANRAPEHICRCFRKYLNLTPTEFLNSLRLEHATNVLRQTEDKIASVAHQCGFQSLRYFFQKFRQAYGMSPAEYRKTFAQSQLPI